MTTLAKVTFQSITGLPEDVVVNTFHFGTIGHAKYSPIATISDPLLAFYNDLAPGQTVTLSTYLSEFVSRAALSMVVDFYDLNDASPRVPYATVSTAPDAVGSADNEPEEVALVVSWKAAPVSGVPAGRLRGRTYLGPLNDATATNGTAPVRPTAGFMADIAAAGAEFIDAASGEFVIYSRAATPDLASEVVSGHVDDAFDTMRSRGPDALNRTIFP